MQLLQEESELQEIVRLVGVDSLSTADRLKLEVARSIREDFLHQNSFHDVDTYTSSEKQFAMLDAILELKRQGQRALDSGANFGELVNLSVRENISRAKYIEEENIEKIVAIKVEIKKQIECLIPEGGL